MEFRSTWARRRTIPLAWIPKKIFSASQKFFGSADSIVSRPTGGLLYLRTHVLRPAPGLCSSHAFRDCGVGVEQYFNPLRGCTLRQVLLREFIHRRNERLHA